MNFSELIKADFPDWPQEVIDSWLVRHARRQNFGWPPPENLEGSQWRYVLERSVAWWRGVTWELSEIELCDDEICERQLDRAIQMEAAYFGNTRNAYSTILDGRERSLSIFGFMSKMGDLPVAPVALLRKDGLDMIDGNHRYMCWRRYGRFRPEWLARAGWAARNPRTKVWIGTHSDL